VTALIGGIFAVIVTPIVESTGACRADQAGFCLPVTTGLVVSAGIAAVLFVVAYVLRLSWAWAAWSVVAMLVVVEFVIQTSLLDLAWSALLVPGVAAALSFRRPDREVSLRVRNARLVALACVAVQFVVWLVFLLVAPA